MDEVIKAIPHRPPFLFVDRIVEQKDNAIRTEKKIDPAEPFFKGHYPGHPIMPGVLILESVFQSGAILMSRLSGAMQGKLPVISRISNVKFKHPVRPGDVMELSVELKDRAGSAHYMKGEARVGGKTALTAEFTVMLVEETQ